MRAEREGRGGAAPSDLEGRRLPEFADRLAELVGRYRSAGVPPGGVDVVHPAASGEIRSSGRARKVSVSIPEDLTAAVQQRVGRGAFSQYVTDAVARQLELDLLAELADLLEREHGPVPSAVLEKARCAWPDHE
ncbi:MULTISPECIES: hypothetical protein [unclassified Saccharopolyspora]|uniref:hypothetical protein n=1 Tax=unclassified Saccharopolyspora TaxID=2646250 RepID=UPI001CD19765|nr:MULTISPECIES: hypothetical protein [unclassified Saccharopolyspora]MCA1185801.1 hypothetical protein [Saccharopolyspora sp. 6T]MCA1227419.1 hypothetical protein [Saccharopolyspora sp. 6M]MCA1280917.1 hypothetical protein [Saccharopolyspora sp. 7B]